MAGQAAVKAAVSGETDKMVILVRGEGETYSCETGLAPLSEIANGVKEIPEDWISEDRVSMTAKFIKYCQPLIQEKLKFLMRMVCQTTFVYPKNEFEKYWTRIRLNK